MKRQTLTRLFSLLLLFIISVPFAAQAKENGCVQCHESMNGRLGDPPVLWKKSIHAENGIFCNGCHGGDPDDPPNAMSPSRGFVGVPKEQDIPAFCGKCHVGILEDYLKSPHGRALGNGGPTCVTCHSNHLVVKAGLDIISVKNCSTCHSYAQAIKIKEAMEGLEGELEAQSPRIKELKERGVRTDDMEKAIFSARNRYHTLFHDLNPAKVAQQTKEIRASLAKIPAELADYDERVHKRKLAGCAAVAAALLAALLFSLLRKTYRP